MLEKNETQGLLFLLFSGCNIQAQEYLKKKQYQEHQPCKRNQSPHKMKKNEKEQKRY